MTAIELAEEIFASAHAFAQLGDLEVTPNRPQAMFQGHESAAIGAASILCFLRDNFTTTPKETFSRDELLVLLESICGSTDFFPGGIGHQLWGMDCEPLEVEAPDERKVLSDRNEYAAATLERIRRRARNKVLATIAVGCGSLAMGLMIWWCLQ